VEKKQSFLEEFPSKCWFRSSLDRLITKIDNQLRTDVIIVAIVEGHERQQTSRESRSWSAVIRGAV